MKINDMNTLQALGTLFIVRSGDQVTVTIPASSGTVAVCGLPDLPGGHGWHGDTLAARVTERNEKRGVTVLQVRPEGGTFTFSADLLPGEGDSIAFDLDVLAWCEARAAA